MNKPMFDSYGRVVAFLVQSGMFRVTDPCYSPDTWCAGSLPGVLNGAWYGTVTHYKSPSDMKWSQHWYEEEEKRMNKAEGEMRAAGMDEPKISLFFAYDRRRLAESKEQMQAYVGRNSALIAWHNSQDGNEIRQQVLDGMIGWTEHADLDVGVDSGQAGLFDYETWHKMQPWQGSGAGEEEYDRICNLTLETDGSFGATDYGIVSSSGYGDGGYTLFSKTDEDGKIVAAVILFIGEYTEEDEDEDDESEISA